MPRLLSRLDVVAELLNPRSALHMGARPVLCDRNTPQVWVSGDSGFRFFQREGRSGVSWQGGRQGGAEEVRLGGREVQERDGDREKEREWAKGLGERERKAKKNK